jgi:hypothetical protein
VRGSIAVYAAQRRWQAAPFWTGAREPVLIRQEGEKRHAF